MIVNRIVQKIPSSNSSSQSQGLSGDQGQTKERFPLNRITRKIMEKPLVRVLATGEAAQARPVQAARTLALNRTESALLVERIRPMEGSSQAGAEAEASVEPAAQPGSGRHEIDGMIKKVAARHKLPARLIRAVALAESGLDPRARSARGAMGLMQLMPETAQEMGVEDPFDPGQNLDGGARYLKRLLAKYGGDLKLALSAYNWGQGRIDRLGTDNLPAETSAFISRVLAYAKGRG